MMDYYLTRPGAYQPQPYTLPPDEFNKDMIKGIYSGTTPIPIGGAQGIAPPLIKPYAPNTNRIGVPASSNPAPPIALAREFNRRIIKHEPTGTYNNGMGIFEGAQPVHTPYGIDWSEEDARTRSLNSAGAKLVSGAPLPVIDDYIAIALAMAGSPNITEDKKYQVELLASGLAQLKTIKGIRALTLDEIALQNKLMKLITTMSEDLTALNMAVDLPRPAIGLRLPTSGDLYDEAITTRRITAGLFGALGMKTEAKFDEMIATQTATSRRAVAVLNDVADAIEDSGIKLDTISGDIQGLTGVMSTMPATSFLATGSGTGAVSLSGGGGSSSSSSGGLIPSTPIVAPTTPTLVTAPASGTAPPSPSSGAVATPGGMPSLTLSGSKSASAGTSVIPSLSGSEVGTPLLGHMGAPLVPLTDHLDALSPAEKEALARKGGFVVRNETEFIGMLTEIGTPRKLMKEYRAYTAEEKNALVDEINKEIETYHQLTTAPPDVEPDFKAMFTEPITEDMLLDDRKYLSMPTITDTATAFDIVGLNQSLATMLPIASLRMVLNRANEILDASKKRMRDEIAEEEALALEEEERAKAEREAEIESMRIRYGEEFKGRRDIEKAKMEAERVGRETKVQELSDIKNIISDTDGSLFALMKTGDQEAFNAEIDRRGAIIANYEKHLKRTERNEYRKSGNIEAFQETVVKYVAYIDKEIQKLKGETSEETAPSLNDGADSSASEFTVSFETPEEETVAPADSPVVETKEGEASSSEAGLATVHVVSAEEVKGDGSGGLVDEGLPSGKKTPPPVGSKTGSPVLAPTPEAPEVEEVPATGGLLDEGVAGKKKGVAGLSPAEGLIGEIKAPAPGKKLEEEPETGAEYLLPPKELYPEAKGSTLSKYIQTDYIDGDYLKPFKRAEKPAINTLLLYEITGAPPQYVDKDKKAIRGLAQSTPVEYTDVDNTKKTVQFRAIVKRLRDTPRARFSLKTKKLYVV